MANEERVEDIEIRLLLEAIYACYGFDLRGYARASMKRRIHAALAKSGLAHLGELQHQILSDAEFFADILEDLTVRVSEMFRDPPFYRAFRTHVIPVLRTYPLLKIWHAGCATGEEVYASAILLFEEGLYERTQIYATDLSSQALEAARQGLYLTEHRPTFAENYRSAGGTKEFANYYTEAYGRIAMREFLRRNVLFFQHNLVSDHAFGEMNVIFCRNVLIYFGRELRDEVLEKFSQSLRPGGFLCLGTSERISGSKTFLDVASEERIYRHAP